MKYVSKSKGILLFYGFDILLLLIFLVTLLPFSKKNSSAFSSSVLNEKYRNDISHIEISVNEMNVRKNISFEKQEGIWLGSYTYDNGFTSVFPCDSQTIENLISTCSKVVVMYKKAESEKYHSSLRVDEESAAIISFGNGDTVYSKLYYGTQDLLTKRIAVRSEGSEIVYDTENAVDTYLQVNPSFWADPFIYFMGATGYDRHTSELSLRRGLLVSGLNATEEKIVFEKTFENENKLRFNIFNNEDNTYTVIPEIVCGLRTSPEKKKVFEQINYMYSISSWTYEQLVSDNGR